MIIDDSIITQVGETAYKTWKNAALADLVNMLCVDTLEESTINLTTTVDRDGRRVALPSWYSGIWSIEPEGSSGVGYQVNYDKDDGLSPATQYATTITLNDVYPAGTKILVNGTHGFKRLPAPLVNILAAIIQADQSIADRTDSITSKRIEDVSVTYATNSQTTLEHALAPYKALISHWSVCPIKPETGGILAMPTPHYDLPWWMNEQDLGGNDHVIL
jgi:hypothetical protein